jgi:hypothetical protein
MLLVAPLMGCGPRPMGAPVALSEESPDQAIIEGSWEDHFTFHEFTLLKAVDGRPAEIFACRTVEKDYSFWTGATYEMRCPTPAAGALPTVTAEESVQAKTPGIGESTVVSVEPGKHAVVLVRDIVTFYPCGLGNCESNPAGYVHQTELQLVAEPRHRYQALTAEASGRYWAWIVDAMSGAVVAGEPPPP